jgi:hypothetical protein
LEGRGATWLVRSKVCFTKTIKVIGTSFDEAYQNFKMRANRGFGERGRAAHMVRYGVARKLRK